MTRTPLFLIHQLLHENGLSTRTVRFLRNFLFNVRGEIPLPFFNKWIRLDMWIQFNNALLSID